MFKKIARQLKELNEDWQIYLALCYPESKIIQKWHTFKADWREYQKLRRVAASAWHKLDSIRAKITKHYDTGDGSKVNSCIGSTIKYTPIFVIDPVDGYNGRSFDISVQEKYCPHFSDGMKPCSQTQCPYCVRNHEYVAAANELKEACTKRRIFWNKQKTK